MLDFLFIFLIAFVFSVCMTGPGGWVHPRDGSYVTGFFFLLLLFGLVMWAVSIWVEPVGPVLMGFAWTAPIIAALILSLLLLAMSIPGSRRTKTRGDAFDRSGPEGADAPRKELGTAFWILIAVLALVCCLTILRTYD